MGETHSPSFAHVGYNISPLSRVNLKISNLTLLSGDTGNWRKIYIYLYWIKNYIWVSLLVLIRSTELCT